MAKIRVSIDGESYLVPKDKIELYMKKLDITEEESVRLYLEENGIIQNEEYEDANEIAGQNSRQFTQVQKKKKNTTSNKKKESKDTVKIDLINQLHTLLIGSVNDIVITNPTKMIEFEYEGENFKLDLIRKKKK